MVVIEDALVGLRDGGDQLLDGVLARLQGQQLTRQDETGEPLRSRELGRKALVRSLLRHRGPDQPEE